MKEFDKCNFCSSYDTDSGCSDPYCQNHGDYILDIHKLIAKARERGMSVNDVMTKMCETMNRDMGDK